MSSKPIPQSRKNPPMPSYFPKDVAGRNQFLAVLGPNREEHRTLFNRLCDFWEPEMSYEDFIAKVGGEYTNLEHSLKGLMTRLESGCCGLITTVWRNESMERDRIILTDMDSLRFWYWRLETAWQECRSSSLHPFPDESVFAQSSARIEMQNLALTDISDSFISARQDQIIIYGLSELSETVIVVTPATLLLLVETAMMKIRVVLGPDGPLEPVLSRLLGMVSSELQRNLITADKDFWNKLTDAMIVHRETLIAKRANLPQDLFVAAVLLKHYTDNCLEDSRRQKREKEAKQKALKDILARLAAKENFLMSPKEFDEQFVFYKEQWPDLKNLFIAQYMQPDESKGLPTVVTVNGRYLVRDHLYPLFRLLHEAAALELKNHYQGLMEYLLKTMSRNQMTLFLQVELLCRDIKDRVDKHHPDLSDMLSTPLLVSEGVIHYVAHVLKIPDIGKVKNILHTYFEDGSKKFKNMDELFDLRPLSLFSTAFQRLSLMRRLFLKLFGYYSNYMYFLKETGVSSYRPHRAERSSDDQNIDWRLSPPPVPGRRRIPPPVPRRMRNTRRSTISSSGTRPGKRSEKPFTRTVRRVRRRTS